MPSQPDEPKNPAPGPNGLSRRSFLRGLGVAGAVAVIAEPPRFVHAADTPEPPAPAGAPTILTVNGKPHPVQVETRTTLLNALRNHIDPGITGPKLVCDIGTCGACTVLLDGKPALSCLVLAVDAVGKKITTVEGLGTPDHLNPIQAAFVAKDALMCGFCTPGFVTTLTALLEKNPKPTPDEIREACKGNFCRCGTYPKIFEATLMASGQNRPHKPSANP